METERVQVSAAEQRAREHPSLPDCCSQRRRAVPRGRTEAMGDTPARAINRQTDSAPVPVVCTHRHTNKRGRRTSDERRRPHGRWAPEIRTGHKWVLQSIVSKYKPNQRDGKSKES
eukprot:4874487-Pleurochrysis_carterae.AAC.1